MFRLHNLSIRNKVLLIALIGGCGLLLNIYLTHIVVKENTARLQKIKDVHYPTIERTDTSIIQLDNIKKSFSEAISAGENIFIKNSLPEKNRFHKSLDSIAEISPDKSAIIQKIKSDFDKYYNANKLLAEGIISGSLQSIALQPAVHTTNTSLNTLEKSLLGFRDKNLHEFSYSIDKTDLTAQDSLDIGIIISIVVGWMLLFSTLAVTTTITDSFNKVIESLTNIATGNNKQKTSTQNDLTDGPEELIRLRNALVDVTNKFQKTENEVIDLNHSLQNKVDLATTQLRSINRELEIAVNSANQANQAKSNFLASMSHELRTPMNAIIGYGELIEEEAENKDYSNLESDIQKIQFSSRHLLDLINDILDLSKIEAGKMELIPEFFSLTQLVEDVSSTITPLVSNRNNTYTMNIQTESDEMFGDLTKLRQILLNLLSNSCKFSKNNEIKLSITSHDRRNEEYLHFEVSDSGIGIPANKTETLFESFSQVDPTKTRKFGGTGLGLAISRHYCEMMGGSIEVESTENVGSTFIVKLPVRYIEEDEVA